MQRKVKQQILKSQRGMTLVEIMVVLIILATLSTVLIRTVTGALNKAKFNQAKILIGEIGKALDTYYADCNSFPTTDQGLEALLHQPTSGKPCPNWGPEAYMPKKPSDPWGRDLVYTSDGLTYKLKSFGKDGQEGGEGAGRDVSNEDL